VTNESFPTLATSRNREAAKLVYAELGTKEFAADLEATIAASHWRLRQILELFRFADMRVEEQAVPLACAGLAITIVELTGDSEEVRHGLRRLLAARDLWMRTAQERMIELKFDIAHSLQEPETLSIDEPDPADADPTAAPASPAT
jgi:hypothetical protein